MTERANRVATLAELRTLNVSSMLTSYRAELCEDMATRLTQNGPLLGIPLATGADVLGHPGGSMTWPAISEIRSLAVSLNFHLCSV